MLQIISGRFFGSGEITVNEQDAVLYSNLCWPMPLPVLDMELRAASLPGRSISSYVLRFKNRYERFPGDIMVLGSAEQAVDQFRMLCALWFRAYFHEDRSQVEHLCRVSSRGDHDSHVPRLFVPRFFDAGLFSTLAEAEGFSPFVSKVVRMPREKYRLLMSCLETYLDSLEAIGTNFDLSYSMMVYALEALSQGQDGYVPAWADYPAETRTSLEEEFGQIDPAVAERIRGTLLGAAHLKLMKRFVSFTLDHVTDQFFTDEPVTFGVANALPRSKMEHALQNLYNSRSKYVHSLKKVRDQLGTPGAWQAVDAFEWDHSEYFTYPGLVRLVRHVLMNFIRRQPETDREEYPGWRAEMPNQLTIMAAARYWIWQSDGFTAETARSYLNGFLEHLASLLSEEPKSIPNLNGVMDRIESLAASTKRDLRKAMLALYWAYHAICPPEGRRAGHEAFLERHEGELERCTIESLAVFSYFGVRPEAWTAADCAAVYNAYERSRYAPTAVNLPSAFEVTSMAFIANRYLDEGDPDSYARWVNRAILDAPGWPAAQEVLQTSVDTNAPVDVASLLGLGRRPDSEAPAGLPAAETVCDGSGQEGSPGPPETAPEVPPKVPPSGTLSEGSTAGLPPKAPDSAAT